MANVPAGSRWIFSAFIAGILVVFLLAFGASALATVPARFWGLLPLIAAALVLLASTGGINPLALATGEDNRLSLSQFQVLFWTIIVLYAYSGLFAHNLRVAIPAVSATPVAVPRAAPSGAPSPTPSPTPTPSPSNSASPTTVAGSTPPGMEPISFPQSVLLLLGFSVTTLIGAAGITASQVTTGVIGKPKLPAPDLSLKWLILTDGGRVDLTRFQVLLWTLVAGMVFLGDTWILGTAPKLAGSLPDIGNALVLLMGFGQAAYIGGKLVVTPGRPIIYRLSTTLATPGQSVTLIGVGFGKPSATSSLLLNGNQVTVPDSSWNDTSIAFTIPAKDPNTAADWPKQPAPPTNASLVVAVGALQSDATTLRISAGA